MQQVGVRQYRDGFIEEQVGVRQWVQIHVIVELSGGYRCKQVRMPTLGGQTQDLSAASQYATRP